MTLILVYSEEADDDLEQMWNDTEARRGELQADALIDEVCSQLEVLKQHPSIGKARDEVRLGLRSWPVNRYIAFYRIGVVNVEIIRILHSRQDISSVF